MKRSFIIAKFQFIYEKMAAIGTTAAIILLMMPPEAASRSRKL